MIKIFNSDQPEILTMYETNRISATYLKEELLSLRQASPKEGAETQRIDLVSNLNSAL